MSEDAIKLAQLMSKDKVLENRLYNLAEDARSAEGESRLHEAIAQALGKTNAHPRTILNAAYQIVRKYG